MFPLQSASTPSGYFLQRSLRFRASASAYLSRTPASAGNMKTYTWSMWVKRGAIGSGSYNFLASQYTTSNYCFIGFENDTLRYYEAQVGATINLVTTQLFRDPAAWYHIVIAVDTTQATASNRIKIYVNGNQVTAFSSSTYPAQNYDTFFNNALLHYIGRGDNAPGTPFYFDGYLAEVNFVNALQLTPSSFGSTNTTTGVWQPAPYTGTYGTNGFYLPFTDNSALTTSSNVGLGKDFSGNGNYWTTNNISITAGVTYDSMTDVPTLTSATAANFAVLNNLNGQGGATANGNLQFARSAGSWGSRVSTIQATTGKYYFEVTGIADVVTQGVMVGVSGSIPTDPQYIGQYTNSYSYYSSDGRLYYNGTNAALGATWNNGDVIGVAIDIDAGTLKFYKNNTQQGSTVTGLSGPYYFGFSSYSSGTAAINYGQQPFAYTPPTGFVALNTYNLPTSTIVKGSTAMNIALDTGANIKTATEALFTGSQYLEWIKDRANSNNFQLLDTLRVSRN